LSQLFGDMGPFFVGAVLSSLDRTLRRIAAGKREWKIVVDGEERSGGKYQAMIVVNGYLGPDLPFAGSAPLGSGRFHMYAIRDLGLLRLPGQFRRAWDASILRSPGRFGFESYEIEGEMVLSPGGGQSFPVNVDGSTLECTGQVSFRIVDRINLIAAAGIGPDPAGGVA
jgi:diacylglycerol kinase family enzyme